MVDTIKSGKYPFVMCNFAPPDMVGHTGVYEAAVVACAATGILLSLISYPIGMCNWNSRFSSIVFPLCSQTKVLVKSSKHVRSVAM